MCTRLSFSFIVCLSLCDCACLCLSFHDVFANAVGLAPEIKLMLMMITDSCTEDKAIYNCRRQVFCRLFSTR